LLNYYISTKSLVEAAKTATIVARQEQDTGNYNAAHATLLRACKELKAKHVQLPKDVLDALRVLHFYRLVRVQVGLKNHKTAARLLMHVVDNISKFPGREFSQSVC